MDFQRLFDILAYQQSKYPQKKALCARDTRGKEWKCWNTSEAIEKIDALSIGMLKNGFKGGEKVALIAQNGSPSWNFVDLAAQQIACVVIPVYTTMSENDFDFIVKDADIKYYFFGAEQIYQKFCSKLPPTAKSWALGNESIADLPSWEQLAKFVMTNEYRNEINRIKAEISNDSIATIIYTSGTTGHPKGVMLSHRNIISNIISTITLVPTKCGDRVVSFLPLSHIFERMVTYTYMAAGLNIYYISDIRLALKEIKEVRPRFFTTVPLWLNRIYDQILIRNSKRPLILRKIFDWAINVGLQYKLNSYFPFLYWIKLFIADVLVFQWWRLTLGGKLRGIIVGAAALDVKLIRLFAAAGIHVREGYGLTETSPVVSFNRFHAGGVKFGTVGIPIPGVEVKIFEPDENGEGEIWVKGENVMKGYFNLPLEATHQVLTSDGWFKTGDIGKWVHKRFLKITDRRKDIFKTSSGRFVA
ncbi:MAG: AMP-binding protein, partial [Saprospiraceae bacterium]|nr:AMP-binding protein [Saprospiraceae bacterium]